MEAIIPYLSFTGTTKSAFDFYAKALGGSIDFLQTFGESGQEVPAEYKEKVMHAVFKAGDLTLMASDIIDDKFPLINGTNISLSMNFVNEADIDRVFTAMSEGATITMPLQDTFWGAKFGMLTDKWNINWMFNFDKPKG